MQITRFRPEHLEAAAELATAGFALERKHIATLPRRHEDKSGLLPLLERLAGKAPAVAALDDDGTLLGFLMGMNLPSFKGTQRGVYCPEWAHAAAGGAPGRRAEIYRRLYGCISAEWVGSGCFTHALTLFAHDDELADALFRIGFGMLVIDAVRSLEPVEGGYGEGNGVPGAEGKVEIRQAGPKDIAHLLPLAGEFQRHAAAAPTFLPLLVAQDRDHFEEWLSEPDHTLWMAFQGHDAIGYMCSEPTNDWECHAVSDPRTLRLSGAYLRQALRGRGVASSLLGRVVEWARSHDYERCAVDFESANFLGASFWLRHFVPVCHSLIRHVDERVASANGGSTDSAR